MADRARRVLTELDRARAELTPAPGAVAGIVSVGMLESTAGLLAEPLVAAVLRHHPGIELRVVTAYSGHLQRWLDDGDLDVSLLYSLTSIPSLNVRTLVRERLWAVAPLSDGLSAGHPVPVARLAAHRLVMPAPGHALRTLIDQIPDYIFIKDKHGRFLLSNISHARAAKAQTAQALLGKTANYFFPSEFAELTDQVRQIANVLHRKIN